MVRFAGLKFDLPEGWCDITDDLDGGSPWTLAREDGVGAIQFSVGRQTAGELSTVDEGSLDGMLREFCARNAISLTSSLVRPSRSLAVGGASRSGDDIVGIWYLTDGQAVAMVTYTADVADHDEVSRELADAEAIIRTITF